MYTKGFFFFFFGLRFFSAAAISSAIPNQPRSGTLLSAVIKVSAINVIIKKSVVGQQLTHARPGPTELEASRNGTPIFFSLWVQFFFQANEWSYVEWSSERAPP
jgi:hypothetical protein